MARRQCAWVLYIWTNLTTISWGDSHPFSVSAVARNRVIHSSPFSVLFDSFLISFFIYFSRMRHENNMKIKPKRILFAKWCPPPFCKESSFRFQFHSHFGMLNLNSTICSLPAQRYHTCSFSPLTLCKDNSATFPSMQVLECGYVAHLNCLDWDQVCHPLFTLLGDVIPWCFLVYQCLYMFAQVLYQQAVSLTLSTLKHH